MEQTKKIAKELAEEITAKGRGEKATIIGLYGDLGSGKTTFTKYFAENFGVEEEVQSPTFIIMRIFELKRSTFKHLIHIDAYRLEKAEELLNLGWNELISHPGNLICIEWPERVSQIMPPHIQLKFEHISENERKIEIVF